MSNLLSEKILKTLGLTGIKTERIEYEIYNDKIIKAISEYNKVKKIIFLDIDGVMNSELDWELKDRETEENRTYNISKRCISNLNYLIERTGAEVVMTSGRRSHSMKDMQKIFEDCGFKGKIISYTPDLRNSSFKVLRGNEILQWIEDNKDYIGCSAYKYNKYVILDDDSDMLYCQKDNFIWIDPYLGLTNTTAYKAKNILNK